MGVMNDCFPGGVLGGFLMWCGRGCLERGRAESAEQSRDVPEHQPHHYSYSATMYCIEHTR